VEETAQTNSPFSEGGEVQQRAKKLEVKKSDQTKKRHQSRSGGKSKSIHQKEANKRKLTGNRRE